jgi:hypothetical protein
MEHETALGKEARQQKKFIRPVKSNTLPLSLVNNKAGRQHESGFFFSVNLFLVFFPGFNHFRLWVFAFDFYFN